MQGRGPGGTGRCAGEFLDVWAGKGDAEIRPLTEDDAGPAAGHAFQAGFGAEEAHEHLAAGGEECRWPFSLPARGRADAIYRRFAGGLHAACTRPVERHRPARSGRPWLALAYLAGLVEALRLARRGCFGKGARIYQARRELAGLDCPEKRQPPNALP